VDFEQEVQPAEELPEKGFSTPLMPKVENFFVTSAPSHLGHLTSVEPKTSFSNSSPQEPHLYSKMGMPNYSKAPPPPARRPGGDPR
jgi:hypothetical protein